MTGNGALGELMTEEVDLGTAGGLYLWQRFYWYVDMSSVYCRAGVSLLVPGSRPLSPWATPFLPFDRRMWIAVLLSLLAAALSISLVTRLSYKFTRFREELLSLGQFFTWWDSLLRAVGLIVLQSPSSRLVGGSPNRPLFTSFEILFLFISALYAACLAAILTVPRMSAPIDSVRELLASGMQWVCPHEAFLYSLQGGDDADTLTLIDRSLVKSEEELMAMNLPDNFGVAIELLTSGYSAEQEHITAEVLAKSHVMKEFLYTSYVSIGLQKGSPYTENMNSLILKVVEAGIETYWEGEVAREYLTTSVQTMVQQARHGEHDPEVPTPLQLQHIQGTLYILLFGLSISFISFIFETMICIKKSVSR